MKNLINVLEIIAAAISFVSFVFVAWVFLSWLNVAFNNCSPETIKNIWDWNFFVILCP